MWLAVAIWTQAKFGASEEQSCRRRPVHSIQCAANGVTSATPNGPRSWTADSGTSTADRHGWEQFRTVDRRAESGRRGASLDDVDRGRRHRFDGAAARRDRHRQGALRHPDPRTQRPPRPQHGARQLLGHPGDADGERVVRPRAAAPSPTRIARQIGRFELADQSSIFLDEIGELTPEIQVKLLRVLEERQFERLGSPKPIHVDTRVIAATHRNLEPRIADGSFREDLFYRLNVFPIRVPPLRERVDDIPLLVWRFVAEFSEDVRQADRQRLAARTWPRCSATLARQHSRAAQRRRARDDSSPTVRGWSIPVPSRAQDRRWPVAAKSWSDVETRAHPDRARLGPLEDSRRRRRGRSARAAADDARDAHGQAGDHSRPRPS